MASLSRQGFHQWRTYSMTAFAKVCVFVCVVLCYAMAQADAPSVKVYPLQHQIAASLLPAIDGILQPGESINEYNNQLVINASSSTHRQIETLLSQLDKPSRNLLISVRNDSTGISENSNHGIG